MKKFCKIVLKLLVFYLLLNGIIYLIMDFIIFMPPTHTPHVESLYSVCVDSKRKIDLTVYESSPDSSLVNILFFHGNGEDIYLCQQMINTSKYRYFFVDYRGYGASGGDISSNHFESDALKIYDYLIENRNVDTNRLFLHGFSLGGAAAISIASKRPCAGLIAQSTFKSVLTVPFGFNPFIFDKLCSLSIIEKVNVPICFIHGEEDQIISISHSKALYNAAKTHKQSHWIKKAGHNDLEYVIGSKAYATIIDDFIKSTLRKELR